MSELRISAVICTRDRTELLVRALQSLESNRGQLHEILVIDNAPSDQSTREAVSQKFGQIRYVCEETPGLNYARNRALVEAQGDVVAYLDDDAVADVHWAAQLQAVFSRYPEVALCAGRVLALNPEAPAQQLFEANGGFDRGTEAVMLPGDQIKPLHGRRASLIAWAVSVGNGTSFAVRRKVAMALGGFDEALDRGPELPGGGDLDMFWRVLEAGYQLRYEPLVLAHHEHRRDMPGVIAQLAGHQRALIAFLVKSYGHAQGRVKISLGIFLLWRLMKPWIRSLRRIFRKDPLPLKILLRMGKETWQGLAAYRPVDDPESDALSEILRFRELLHSLVIRNLKIKYQRSVFGFVWTAINPLMMIAVLSVVFSHVVRIEMHHYLAFLVSGYFVWNFILQTLSASSFMLSEHAQLTRSVRFPMEVPVLASVAAKLIEFAIELVLVLVALICLHYSSFAWGLLFLPWLVTMQILLMLGLAMPIAAMSIFYRDIEHVLPIILTALFYVSPVFYPLSMVPEDLRRWYLLNPIAQLMTVYHRVVYEGLPPTGAQFLVLSLTAILIFTVGYWIFNRYKRDVAEVV